MNPVNYSKYLENSRRGAIARKVRELRIARGLTQGELAATLGLSQNRLSEVERGRGSFTAEQLLVLLRLFNVPVAELDPIAPVDQRTRLQNELALLGAIHLRESESVLLGDEAQDVVAVLRDALISGDPRLVTASAPVLVEHIDRGVLSRLDLELRLAGRSLRAPWLVDNVRAALRLQLAGRLDRKWVSRYRRAELVLDTYLEGWSTPEAQGVHLDILDTNIRSKRTIEEVKARRSKQSARWGIVTGLQPDDFARALEAARAGD
jgi:transcriptional regulator with XRE-family HTH domain